MNNVQNIKQCTVVLTRECNLRCNFCFAKQAGYSLCDQLDFSKLKNIVDFCAEANVEYLFFNGGEPLLYKGLTEILRYAKTQSPSITTAIASNGVALKDKSFCLELIDSGLDYIDLSIKGHDAESWRQATKKDGFDDYLKAIQNLSEINMNFTCSMVLTHSNIANFCDAVRVAKDNGAKQFSFTFVIDNEARAPKNLQYLQSFNPFHLIDGFCQQIPKLDEIIQDWWLEYSFPLCFYTEEQLELLQGKMASPCQVHKQNSITINTNLELLPCDMYFKQPLGVFGKDFSNFQEFTEFVKTSRYQDVITPLINLPSSTCKECKYLSSCFGGCPVLWKHYSFDDVQDFKKLNNSMCSEK